MARWIKVNARMRSMQDIERAEKMELPDSTIAESYNPVTIDATRIMAYCISYDKDGEPTDGSEITFENGAELVTDMPFELLDKLIRQNT